MHLLTVKERKYANWRERTRGEGRGGDGTGGEGRGEEKRRQKGFKSSIGGKKEHEGLEV